MKYIIVLFLIPLFQIILGGISLWYGLSTYFSQQEFLKNAVETKAFITNYETKAIREGQISDAERSKNTLIFANVEFEVDGVKYSGRLNRSSHDLLESHVTTIYYNKDNPNEFIGLISNDSIITSITIGVAFLVLGFVILIFFIKIFKKK